MTSAVITFWIITFCGASHGSTNFFQLASVPAPARIPPSPGSLVGVAFVVVAGRVVAVAAGCSVAVVVAAGALLAPAVVPVPVVVPVSVVLEPLEQAAVSARAPMATDVNRPARFNT
ncbi:hypothetical protein GCM10010168_62480 [Actinoplanes ianthinogenes]|uniref:Uncharacterized protein n=1 Tax=Actinoplanes ianthinogenes TaxID=122358 RepID=A0ABN6C598_9ACTN|nr:hypothetical protein Aiant_01610 [Actinoplanes ianthinogenes]GGR35624.1 hypothetical protein GCM10010168_62480 [Actinoplanes ianthinogenes]